MHYTDSKSGSVRCSTMKGAAILGILEGCKHRSIFLLLKKHLSFRTDSDTASFHGPSRLLLLLQNVVTKVLHRNYIFKFVHFRLICSVQEFPYFQDRQIYLHFLDQSLYPTQGHTATFFSTDSCVNFIQMQSAASLVISVIASLILNTLREHLPVICYYL